MNNEEKEETFDGAILEGLLKARDAFEKYLEDCGYDSAYADIRFTAWVVDSGFTTRLRRMEIEGELK